MNSTFFYEIRTIQYVTGKSNANVTKVQYVKYTFNIHHTLMCDKKNCHEKIYLSKYYQWQNDSRNDCSPTMYLDIYISF